MPQQENHLRFFPSQPGRSAVERAVAQAREKDPRARASAPSLEVEVTSLQEFRQALSAQADRILLDNMRLSEIQEAVRLRNAAGRARGARKPQLEVSGGVNLSNVRALALAGVDRISVGALTHSAPTLDVALEIWPL